LLLIGRDQDAIAHYLPMLERCANFIESRRDPENNLFLAGAAGNLLAPSFAGWKQPDGTYKHAYLTGLSVTYIAALDRLIELEKIVDNTETAEELTKRRDAAREGLAAVTTDEGYLIKSLDPDGARHGVYGAKKYGYFEASPNHDAMAFRVVDDGQAQKIYDKIVSIPNLRRHGVIIANEPGLDDMYDPGESWLWKHGTWVNGGHWSTCEARMVMGYYRVGAYDDIKRSVEHMFGFARRFRMDNPLVEFGSKVYQPKHPTNLCYDSFGPLAASVRGLFEYLYTADSLTLIPHIPPEITRLEQRFPIRFGDKRLYIATAGSGSITGVLVDGKAWSHFDAERVHLKFGFPHATTGETIRVEILLGGASPTPWQGESTVSVRASNAEELAAQLERLQPAEDPGFERVAAFLDLAAKNKQAVSYEARHAALVLDYVATAAARVALPAERRLPEEPEETRAAADTSYIETAVKLCQGLVQTLNRYADFKDLHEARIHRLWVEADRTD
jgi:hypothetical protein